MVGIEFEVWVRTKTPVLGSSSPILVNFKSTYELVKWLIENGPELATINIREVLVEEGPAFRGFPTVLQR